MTNLDGNTKSSLILFRLRTIFPVGIFILFSPDELSTKIKDLFCRHKITVDFYFHNLRFIYVTGVFITGSNQSYSSKFSYIVELKYSDTGCNGPITNYRNWPKKKLSAKFCYC